MSRQSVYSNKSRKFFTEISRYKKQFRVVSMIFQLRILLGTRHQPVVQCAPLRLSTAANDQKVRSVKNDIVRPSRCLHIARLAPNSRCRVQLANCTGRWIAAKDVKSTLNVDN